MKVTLNVSPPTDLDHKITIYGIKSTKNAVIHVRKLVSDTAGNELMNTENWVLACVLHGTYCNLRFQTFSVRLWNDLHENLLTQLWFVLYTMGLVKTKILLIEHF